MTRIAPARLAVGWLLFALALHAQPPQFEVATIKRAAPEATRNYVMPSPPDRLSIPSMSLVWLIYTAYADGMGTSFNVSGGPAWANRTPFAIEAKAAQPATRGQLRLLLRTLLEDRFGLKLRRETTTGDIFALQLDGPEFKPGPNLKPWDGTCAGKPPVDSGQFDPADPYIPRCPSGYRTDGLHLEGATLLSAAELLSLPQSRNILGTIVQNQTGLTERYTMHLDFNFTRPRPADPTNPNATPEFAGPTLFEAIRQQWGLKLNPSKGPLQRLIIETATLPAEN